MRSSSANHLGRGPSTALLAAIALTLLPAAAAARGGPEVRVLLTEGARRPVLRAPSMAIERETEKGWERLLGGVRAAAFSARGGAVLLEGSGVEARRFRVRPAGGEGLAVDKHAVRGGLLLSAADGGVDVVNVVPVEEYLAGVVQGEVDPRWPLEAVKAQVVASRTFVLHRMQAQNPLFDVRDTVMDQVYVGPHVEDERAAQAVRETEGLALFFDGTLVPAFFHSSCGGETADAGRTWGAPHPSLVSVPCDDCGDAPHRSWRLTLPSEELAEALEPLLAPGVHPQRVSVAGRHPDGRVATLSVGTDCGTTLVDAEAFRAEVGYRRLPSTRFTMTARDGSVLFEGSGYGHGVGLCQWGAKGAADRGLSYRQILSRYYPGATLHRAY